MKNSNLVYAITYTHPTASGRIATSRTLTWTKDECEEICKRIERTPDYKLTDLTAYYQWELYDDTPIYDEDF